MRPLTAILLSDLHQSVGLRTRTGDITNERWRLHWRFGERRIEDKVRENVFSIANIELAGRSRGKGHLTELLGHLSEHPELGDRPVEWIYFEQVRYRLAEHLKRELNYRADFGMVIDCWRPVTGQLEMRL